ncbi:uncharacterized protein LOC143197604 [Rhynchophorus ferrugineus]|uniref:Uncharacterized protein n=1 Tax=Rhynchophorus ferrugineus TaxID=354439 RepID=A0A834MM22_RHYFE|nr:hypothetical protein GWI33_003356 [Rhynchophorus ferrugineus]
MVLIREWTEDEDWGESRTALTNNPQFESPRPHRIVDFVSIDEVRYYSSSSPPRYVARPLLMITDGVIPQRLPIRLRIFRYIRNRLATKKYGGKTVLKWMNIVISYAALVVLMIAVMAVMYYAMTYTTSKEFGTGGNNDNNETLY